MLKLIVLIGLSACASAAPSYVHTFGVARGSIGNDLVERTISYSEQTGLRTDRLLYKPTGRDLTAYSRTRNQVSDEFGFTAGAQLLTGSRSFLFEHAQISDVSGGGKQLSLQLASRDRSLRVSVNYAVYNGHPAIRKWITISNAGAQEVRLSGMHFEALAAAPGEPAELDTSAGYGAVPEPAFFTGRVSDCCTFIRNSATHEGIAIINEAPGYLKRTEAGIGWSEAFQVMYDTDLFPFARSLAPSETFESAKSSTILFRDGQGFEDSRWAVPGYVSRIIARRYEQKAPPWLYNTWEPLERRIDQTTLDQLAPAAKAMGIDIFRSMTDGKLNTVRTRSITAGSREALRASSLRWTAIISA